MREESSCWASYISLLSPSQCRFSVDSCVALTGVVRLGREKANSNICTAQALLSNTAAMYAVYHGPGGLKKIALRVNGLAKTLAAGLRAQGLAVSSEPFFDTVKVEVADAAAVLKTAVEHGYNLRQLAPTSITVSFDETTNDQDVAAVLAVFGKHAKAKAPSVEQLAGGVTPGFEGALARTSTYMTQEVFQRYHTETEMMRYMFKLQSKDLGLNSSIIPLGSCTMKLNAAAEMIPITWPEINNIHPFVPLDQVPGYQAMLQELGEWLIDITGFDAITLQPNAGAAGEYAGLMCIREYHRARGDGGKRNVCLIPRAAHGTNPATAAMCGMDVVPIECDDQVMRAVHPVAAGRDEGWGGLERGASRFRTDRLRDRSPAFDDELRRGAAWRGTGRATRT